MNEVILQGWYFHLPNYLLAIMMYSALGRLALSFIVRPDSKNYIYRAFVWLSKPAVWTVNFITPRALPFLIVLVLTVLWLYVARIALFFGMQLSGIAPGI